MREWGESPFGDLYAIGSRNGISIPKSQRGMGVPMLGMKELFSRHIIRSVDAELVPLDSSQFDRWCLKNEDLLFGRRSLTRDGAGKVSIFRGGETPCTFESSLIRVRLDSQSASPSFYYYLFRSDLGRGLMDSIIEQVAVAGIRSSDLARLKVPWPPIQEQKRIAAVLGAFDDLIETNRALVESMSSAVRTSTRSAAAVTSLAAFAKAGATKQVRPTGSVEHFSLPAFDNGATPEICDGSEIKSAKYPLKAPTVLVSRLNPKWERCWMAYPDTSAMASTEFVLLQGTDAAVEEVWAVTSDPAFWDQMRSRVTGTTGSHQRVEKEAILGLEVPDVRTLKPEARAWIVDSVQMVQALRDEVSELTHTRDELLPLLMSGRLRITDAEQALAAVQDSKNRLEVS